jgi:hypothetical protein
MTMGPGPDACRNRFRVGAFVFGAAYALMPDGTVRAWGDQWGQLGSGGDCHDGGCPSSADPVQVSGLSGITALAADLTGTAYAAYALRADGTVWG